MYFPYVTFQLHCTKKKDKAENFIQWRCPVNETLLANNRWFLKVKSINLTNVEEGHNISTVGLQVSSNLVKQDFNWLSRARRFDNSDDYPEQHPIMYGNISFEENQSEIQIFDSGQDVYKINNLTDTLEIVAEPIKHENNAKNIRSLTCDASVLVSVYNF